MSVFVFGLLVVVCVYLCSFVLRCVCKLVFVFAWVLVYNCFCERLTVVVSACPSLFAVLAFDRACLWLLAFVCFC